MDNLFAELKWRHLCRLATAYAVVTWVFLSKAALAQWSIGQPGTREAPKGQNRYVYLVMADPLPGREWDFNDGYQNMHMGGCSFRAGRERSVFASYPKSCRAI